MTSSKFADSQINYKVSSQIQVSHVLVFSLYSIVISVPDPLATCLCLNYLCNLPPILRQDLGKVSTSEFKNWCLQTFHDSLQLPFLFSQSITNPLHDMIALHSYITLGVCTQWLLKGIDTPLYEVFYKFYRLSIKCCLISSSWNQICKHNSPSDECENGGNHYREGEYY